MKGDKLNLFSIFRKKIERYNQDLIVTKSNGQSYTYKANIIFAFVNYYEKIMLSNGLKKGDVILLIPDNSISSISIFFTALKIGVVTSFAPIKLNISEICSINTQLKSKILFCSNKYRYAEDLIAENKIIIYKCNEIPEESNNVTSHYDCVKMKNDEVISILFTSGSSGAPSGIMLSARSYYLNILQIGKHIELSSEDTYLQTLPFYYVAGQITSLLMPLFFGANIIISNSTDPASIYDYICNLKPTVTNIVPTLVYRLHQYIQYNMNDTKRLQHNLRICLTGGAGCSEELIQSFRSEYKINLVQGYGSTEGGCGICIANVDSSVKSVGRPLPGHEVKFINKSNLPCNANEVGEIYVKNKVMMLGYYNAPQKTQLKIKDGWYKTEDLGFFDESDYVYICGRVSEFIKRGGEKVFLPEIEETIRKCKFVKDCHLIAIHDNEFGELPLAYICLTDFDDKKYFERWIKQHLSKYKSPLIKYINEIPVNSNGKADSRYLQMIWKKEKSWKGQVSL